MGSPGRRFRFMVLGAGVMGSALAHHLSEAGETSVLLYDRDQPTGGASGRSAGILCSQAWDPWDVALIEETREEYRRISSTWGLGGFRENGGLRTVRSGEGERTLERRREELTRQGVEASVLGPSELARLLPAGRFGDVRAGLFTPHDAVVSAPEITFAYAELASHRGTDVLWGHGEPRLTSGPDGWTLRTLAGTYTAEQVVLACGAWTKGVLARLGAPLPLAPYRTQACRLRPPLSPGVCPSLHDTELDVYVRPAPGGRLIAGDGTERTETDPQRADPAGDFRFLEGIARAFHERLPGWATCHVEEAWAGVCTSTPDRRPIIGPVPGVPGLFVATGMNGFGIMRAGALARRLAQGLLQDRWEPLRPASPERFPDRELAFAPRPGCTLEGERSGSRA